MRQRNCKECGETDRTRFYESVKGGYCKSCFNKRIAKRSIDRKAQIVEYFGGGCVLCGYNKYQGALQLHHLDPNLKDPQYRNIRGWSWDRCARELEKCVLLCANCHAEVEAGITSV